MTYPAKITCAIFFYGISWVLSLAPAVLQYFQLDMLGNPEELTLMDFYFLF